MSNANGGVDLPVTIDTDAAERNLRNLQSAAESLDARLERLEQNATRLTNSLKIPSPDTGKPLKFDSYSDVEGHFANLSPNQVWSLSPKLGQMMSEIGAQRDTIGQRVGSFATWLPSMATSLSGPALYNAYAQWQTPGVGPSAGPLGPLAPAAPATPGPQPTPQDTDRTATTFADRMAQALSRAGAGALGSAANGALGGAGLGAAGDVVSGLVRSLGAEVLAPLAVGAAAVGIGLAANEKVTQYHQEEYGLGAAVGNTLGVSTPNQLIGVQQTGWQFQYSEKDAAKAAQQLGLAGVQQGDINGALANSMALSRLSGGTLSLDQTTGLTGDLMKGGFSNVQVGQAYDEMSKQANLTGVSLDRLVTSLQALERTAGVSALNVNGLAAVQSLAGSSINVGQALGPAVGATGVQAIQQAAILGLSPSAFTRAQGNLPQLWDAYAGLAKRYDKGPYGTQISEEMLQSAGFDMSGLSGPAASTLVQKLATQGPKAAETYYNSLQKKEGTAATDPTKAAEEFLGKSVQAAKDTTTWFQQSAILAEQIEAHFLHAAAAANQLPGSSSKPDATTPSQRRAAAEYHVTPSNPAGPDAIVRTGPQGSVSPLWELPSGEVDKLPAYGMNVPNGLGSTNHATRQQLAEYIAASETTGVPLSILLAQGSAESGFNPKAHNGSALGISQFTPQTVKFMEQTKGSPFYGKTFNPLNEQQGILAAAWYDQYQYQHHGQNWQQALAGYNGSGPEAQAYGQQVYSAAQQVNVEITGTLNVNDQKGAHVGTVQITPHKQTVNTARRPVAHQHYGPERSAPPPHAINRIHGG